MSILVTPTELATVRAASPAQLVLIDVRWSLAVPDGRPAYLEAHLPGAVYADLENELSDHSKHGAGRHPLPSPSDLETTARRWGITQGASVVVYDEGPGIAAARAWWLLKNAGVASVRILDGGLAAWLEEGGAVESGNVKVAPGDVVLSWDRLAVIDADSAALFPSVGVLIDARAGERYRGEVEPVDAVAGHIPGAVNLPTQQNLGPNGRFLSPADLRTRFAKAGIAEGVPTAVYCGSGVTAAHEIAALAIAGIDAALYPGSWSQWSSDPARPVATGAASVEVSA